VPQGTSRAADRKKSLEIPGLVEEKVDPSPPEFPRNPDLPRSSRNLVQYTSRVYHPPPLHLTTQPTRSGYGTGGT
jgi:hypothetical protein